MKRKIRKRTLPDYRSGKDSHRKSDLQGAWDSYSGKYSAYHSKTEYLLNGSISGRYGYSKSET